ncbi:hypothetical protein MRB53_015853 [Persea americana]|uniref:Uncharacterized protein n=1 Tax=Persea americana TaxID=3435 RepID=A0ACC2M0D2_PERAE|nr:hypothetical protein MRB53_015853 [Persea americana]
MSTSLNKLRNIQFGAVLHGCNKPFSTAESDSKPQQQDSSDLKPEHKIGATPNPNTRRQQISLSLLPRSRI